MSTRITIASNTRFHLYFDMMDDEVHLEVSEVNRFTVTNQYVDLTLSDDIVEALLRPRLAIAIRRERRRTE